MGAEHGPPHVRTTGPRSMSYDFVVGARMRSKRRRQVAGRQVGGLEEEVVRQLWDAAGALTGRELLGRLPAPPPAYTTLMTVLARLVDKGLVTRTADGRSHRYQAAGTPAQLTAQAIGRLLASAGDPAAVFAHFVERLDDPALIEELAAALERVRRS